MNQPSLRFDQFVIFKIMPVVGPIFTAISLAAAAGMLLGFGWVGFEIGLRRGEALLGWLL